MKGIISPNLLRDALYNTHERSGATVEYGKGLVVGVVSTIMSFGFSFKNAFDLMLENLPVGYRIDCIPEPWRKEIR